MNWEEKQRQQEEILETIDCFVSVEDELLKLYCLVNCCSVHHRINDQDLVSKDYMKEKIGRIMSQKPIILDSTAKVMFVAIKLGQPRATTPTDQGENQ